MTGPGLLTPLGWNEALAESFAATCSRGDRALEPGRIIRQESLVRVQLAERSVLAKPAGKLLHGARSAEAIPVIGDWVAVAPPPPGGMALIHAVLPRRSTLMRRQIDDDRQVQVIAANVELVFVMGALDAPLNLRRLERMLAITLASGARPVVVLSKADLADDPEARAAEVSGIAGDAQVIVLSAVTDAGVDRLRELIAPGVTGVLIGPSGVGKSTLTNKLLGEARLATTEVREDDRKGRHTTTHRQLFILENGGMLIDGPGMREFGMTSDDAGVGDAFADVEALAAQCRFTDCGHDREPGCAVARAVEGGELDPGRLANWRKLRAERAYLQRQIDPAVRRERRRQGPPAASATQWERAPRKKKG